MSDPDDHVPRRKGIYGDAAASRALLDSLENPAAKPAEPERVWVILDATREWTPAGGLGAGPPAVTVKHASDSDAYWSKRLRQARCAPPPGGSPRLGLHFQVGPGACPATLVRNDGSHTGHSAMSDMCPCNCGNPMAQGPHAGLNAETVAYIERWNLEHSRSGATHRQ